MELAEASVEAFDFGSHTGDCGGGAKPRLTSPLVAAEGRADPAAAAGEPVDVKRRCAARSVARRSACRGSRANFRRQ